jgi:Domain of Unknown Function (DUF1259)
MDGMPMAPVGPMGLAEAINFQPTGDGKAAITGDFVLTDTEVNPVLKSLRSNGIDVTALHNHMLMENPRLYFMHFWANDDAIKLAKGLRAALDKAAVVKHYRVKLGALSYRPAGQGGGLPAAATVRQPKRPGGPALTVGYPC